MKKFIPIAGVLFLAMFVYILTFQNPGAVFANLDEMTKILATASLLYGVSLLVYSIHIFTRRTRWADYPQGLSGAYTYETIAAFLFGIGSIFWLGYMVDFFNLYFLLPNWFITFWDTSI